MSANHSEIAAAGKAPERPHRCPSRQINARFGGEIYIGLQLDGPVAQGIEQQPSKLKVAGSNPAGVTKTFNRLSDRRAPKFASETPQTGANFGIGTLAGLPHSEYVLRHASQNSE